jgi:Protein of unknown function (DUF2786)
VIERIAKLLALAEAASTPAEAEAAFAKAQELASRHAIDLEVARIRQADRNKREVPTTRTTTIGIKGQHANKPLILLYSTIAQNNDISLLIAADSTTIYATGFESDLNVADALWASLATTMVKFGDALVKDKNAEWRTETTRVWSDSLWRYEEKPVTGQGARRAFYDGFTSRIGERLYQARKEAVVEAESRHFHADASGEAVAEIEGSNLPSSMALVLKDKKNEVVEAQEAWFQDRYGRPRRSRRGGWSGGSNARTSSSARAAGRAAADNVSLSGRRGIAN